jgi:hypothetical protein
VTPLGQIASSVLLQELPHRSDDLLGLIEGRKAIAVCDPDESPGEILGQSVRDCGRDQHTVHKENRG